MARIRMLAVLPAVVVFASCAAVGPNGAGRESIRADVERVLDAQVRAWNDGSIDDFMKTYWKSDELRFASGGSVRRGWQETIERYREAYPDRATMGTLRFHVHTVDVLSHETAMVFGEWHLEREKDAPWGLYTLILRKVDGRWLIVHDHTSSAPSGTRTE